MSPDILMTDLSRDEITRYSRHLLLPEVGSSGQLKLKHASVIVIGAGGLGSPVSLYLAAAGVGRLGVVDFDIVDLTNLQRQVLYTVEEIGQAKAEKAREKLLAINPEIEVISHKVRIGAGNVLDLLSSYDIVVDGSDNFTTRYLINDACVLLKKPNVYGSIFRFEGQISVFCAPGGPCYRCLFPTPPPPESVPNCAEGGVLGVLAGVVGTLQATEAIKLIIEEGESLIGKILLYNALEMSFRKLSVKSKSTCPVCGDQPSITRPVEEDIFCSTSSTEYGTSESATADSALQTSIAGSAQNKGHSHRKSSTTCGATPYCNQSKQQGVSSNMEIQAKELVDRMRSGAKVVLLDVRNHDEVAICKIDGSVHIPLPELPNRLSELNKDDEMVVYCKSGVRSMRAIQFMQQAGFNRLQNLKGGIIAWANQVDPALAIY